MRVHDNYKEINVAAQQKDPESVLAMWKQVLKIRKEHGDVLIHGQFEIADFDNLNTFTYVKRYEGKRVLVVLNFSEGEQPFDIPQALKGSKMKLLMSNTDQLGERLSGWEARAYLLE
jgi:oligo-1,6-glucosidase